MKKLIVLLIAIAIPFSAAYACTGFLEGERISGMNKICYYNHLGSTVATTIKSHEICKITIEVQH